MACPDTGWPITWPDTGRARIRRRPKLSLHESPPTEADTVIWRKFFLLSPTIVSSPIQPFSSTSSLNDRRT